MKKTFILILLFLYSLSAYSQDYYYNKDEKIPVKKSNHKNYYLFSNNTKNQDLLEVQSTKVFKKELNWALGRFESNELIEYVSPAMINSNGDTLNFSNLFYVKLKDGKDLEILEKMTKENNLEILGNNEFMPLWYTLSCNKNSKGNALEMANLFYESKLFVFTEVDFLIKYDLNCTNDPYFNDQWGLKNTGQYGGTPGVDISYCNARNITTGNPNIIVAVIDQGIQRGHPDITNIHSSSYDAQTGTVPSKLYYYSDTSDPYNKVYHLQHGTACAGIIGANSNNNKGIAGIAPNCKLMDISHSFKVGPNESYLLANGINWAWQHGASVISNSWGGPLHSQLIDEAISNALTQGRNGKGCVVVFATGNENTNVSYPANSNPDIIAVGAVSICGERKVPGGSSGYISSCEGELGWGSNYGNELDILAPGVLIPTTDVTGNYGYNPEYNIHNAGKIASDYTNQDYTVWFNGTSASCPHVAGVAALILSVNPNLTQRQVADIIEQTAQKTNEYSSLNLNGYIYSTLPAHPNGTWNNEMGYGLVDAYESLRRASCWKNIYNQTISTNTQVNGCVIDVKNTIIPAGVTLKLTATERIILSNGVTVKSGATLEIDGATVTIDPEFTVEEGATFVIK